MKVLLVTTSYPRTKDGSEAAGSFVADFVKVLGEECDVAVVSPKERGDVRSEYGYAFEVPRLPLSLLSPANPSHWREIVITLRAGQRAVEKAVAEFRPDIVFALWALPSGFWAARAGKRFDVPYSIWALGSDSWGLGKVPVVRSVLERVLRGARTCFVDGYQLGEDVEKISGRKAVFLPSSRLLPNRKRNKVSREKGAPLKLAFLGRWHYNKGADLLLEALNLLPDESWKRIQEVRYHGGGPLENEIRTAARDLNAKNRPIVVGGYLGVEEAVDLLQWADYLLVPSRVESIPVIFSDALQTGTPMVATPVGDFPRLFGDSCPGVLAESATPQDFCNALIKALNTEPGLFTDAIVAQKKKFDLRRSVEKFLNLAVKKNV